MATFVISIILLIGGYFIYGKFVERLFGADQNRKTPAYTCGDGVDYVPMNWKKIFLIQFLNIAGLGPIFGAILGAVYGPIAFIWIVVGCIFGGAVHDYMSGMLSVRNNGMSLHGIGEKYMGKGFRNAITFVTLVLMILVGAVFISGPAKILTDLTKGAVNFQLWCGIIFIYYLIATLVPIDKLIGKIYPVFGLALLFMAIGICFALFYNHPDIPNVTFANFHDFSGNPDKPLFPMLFITIACGSISGFHATQSPLMARCIQNEKQGRRIFYGAMIAEGLVGLIWAAAAMSFFGNIDGLKDFLASHSNNAAVVVKTISNKWLGGLGGILAILGVVAAPITSGDTAFRSARLIISDFAKIDQKPVKKRLMVAIPLFVIGFILLLIDFDVIWRYFGWINQLLAASTLWVITTYLLKLKKNFWITLIPGIFMTMVTTTYIFIAPEGFKLSQPVSMTIGGLITLFITVYFFIYRKKINHD